MARLNWLDRLYNNLVGAPDSAIYYNLVDTTGAVYPLGVPPYKLVPVNTLVQAGTPHSGANDNLLIQIEDFDTNATANKPIIRDASGRAKIANPSAAGDITNKGAVDTLLALKAALASPTFTGAPAAPTAAAGTNTTQLATTAFVSTAVSPKAPTASPAFTGNPTAPTPSEGDDATSIATTAFVRTALLYEKIRNITDVNGNPSVSVDLSDIDFSTYREIMLIGEFSQSASVSLALRLNSIATNYTTAKIRSGYTTITAPTTEMGAADAYGTDSTYKGSFEIRLKKNAFGSNLKTDFETMVMRGSNHYWTYGNSTQTTLSSINFVAPSSCIIYLSNVELWGVRR